MVSLHLDTRPPLKEMPAAHCEESDNGAQTRSLERQLAPHGPREAPTSVPFSYGPHIRVAEQLG